MNNTSDENKADKPSGITPIKEPELLFRYWQDALRSAEYLDQRVNAIFWRGVPVMVGTLSASLSLFALFTDPIPAVIAAVFSAIFTYLLSIPIQRYNSLLRRTRATLKELEGLLFTSIPEQSRLISASYVSTIPKSDPRVIRERRRGRPYKMVELPPGLTPPSESFYIWYDILSLVQFGIAYIYVAARGAWFIVPPLVIVTLVAFFLPSIIHQRVYNPSDFI
jgi:hypothetical protein